MIDDYFIEMINQDPGLTDYILDHLPKKIDKPTPSNKSQFITYIRNEEYTDVHLQTVLYLMAEYEGRKND